MLLGMIWAASAVYSERPRQADLGPETPPVDAIICLTGGKGRIKRSLELFEQRRGRLLYISGIDPQVQFGEILKEMRRNGPVDESNIILENVATNTIENAQQVSQFLQERRLRSVLLVTSSYHVRRVNYIFRKLLPKDTTMEITWIEPEPFDSEDWWKSWNGIWVTVGEFLKFFYAYVRLPS